MKKTYPLVDLYVQYLSIKKDIDNAIKTVIQESTFIGGKYVETLEQEIAKYCGVKYAVSLNSGTDALFLSLYSLGITQGDEVITTPFTFIATSEVVALRGAKPVFVDIEPYTFNINPELIEQKITKKTKAIIVVHLFGQPTRMDKIKQIASKHHLYIIEDAAQSIGATYKSKRVGSIGITGCFSFFPSKNLGGYGDGGIITTNNKKIADQIRLFKNHGSIKKYYNTAIGLSSRLDSIQASILLAKLPYLDRWNNKRKDIAYLYSQYLKDIEWIDTPKETPKASHVYHQYTVRVKKGMRNGLKQYLARLGISTMIYYPVPLHLLKAMKYLQYKKGDFPVTEKASSEVLSLPIYPELEKKDISYIAKKIRSYV